MFHRLYKYAKASNCIIKIINIIRLRDRRNRITYRGPLLTDRLNKKKGLLHECSKRIYPALLC